MKPLTLSFAAGVTAVLVYAVCLTLVAVVPVGWVAGYATSLAHSISPSVIVKPSFTAVGVIAGALYAFITAFLIGWLFGLVYNWVEKRAR